jgi:hypothetical protein
LTSSLGPNFLFSDRACTRTLRCPFLTSSFSFITLPFLANDPKAIEVVQIILESILLRREKNMTDIDGKRIVELPKKEVGISCKFCSVNLIRRI